MPSTLPATSLVPADPTLDRFLSDLRAAWKEGEIPPTAQAKPKQKRDRRRPDPFALVSNELKAWFDEEPWRTSREFLQRLQAERPRHIRITAAHVTALEDLAKGKGARNGVRRDGSGQSSR